MGRSSNRGQSILEYAVVVGVVVAAISAMQVYARRGIQAGLKMTADEIGPQTAGLRYEAGERRNRAIVEAGSILARESASRTDARKTMRDAQTADGGRIRIIDEDVTSTSGALSGRGSGVSSYSEVVIDTK